MIIWPTEKYNENVKHLGKNMNILSIYGLTRLKRTRTEHPKFQYTPKLVQEP